ncbi:MAG: agmatine deiminase family protein [Candidatus Binatia bacterium]|jgi:agmatine deiminase
MAAQDSVPGVLGFRMPAEWEPHAATWLAWPHKEDSWPGNFAPIPAVWVDIVRALAPYEAVNILVNGSATAAHVRASLREREVSDRNISMYEIPTDDAWIRDYGPIFITRRAEAAALKWRYNAWGGKYPPWDLDDAAAEKICASLNVPVFHPGIVLEGGSIEVNGRGTLLTTEACLLNPNRNLHLRREEIEHCLRNYLGVRHILWLGQGIAGDDTDGHIDDLARFIDPTTVVTVIENNPHDENFEALQANHDRLLGMTDQDGRPLRVTTLPMPRAIFYKDQRLPASYANFYVANDVVLVPTFRDPNDVVALQTLQGLFPQRRVVGIQATEMVWGLGTVHCVTQQQPLP